MSDYTAKSVIIDITDNYGDPSYSNLRSLDFWKDGSKITLTSGFTAYATTYYSSSFSPDQIFDTSLSKTGGSLDTAWVSTLANYANQRIIIVFDTALDFDSIVINNAHNTGTETDRGSQNVAINISSDSITDTTYDAAISNSTLIYDSTFDQHASSDAEDAQTLTLIGIKASTPVISPTSGAYQTVQLISMACSTSGANIYYTDDGSAPDATDTLYSAPFALTSAKTIKAIGIKSGFDDSDIVTEIYTIAVISTQPIITILT